MHLSALPFATGFKLLLLLAVFRRSLVKAESLRGDGPDALPPKSGANLSLSWPGGTTAERFTKVAFELTKKNPENDTGPAIEGIVTRFNETSFNETASTVKWIALFDCDNTTRTTDRISNAAKLGARAIIAYSNLYRFCVATNADPPSPIPIYSSEGQAALGFASLLEGLPALKLFDYNSTQLNAAADVIDNDLRTNSLESGGLIFRIARNVTVTTTSSIAAPSGTLRPNTGLVSHHLSGHLVIMALVVTILCV